MPLLQYTVQEPGAPSVQLVAMGTHCSQVCVTCFQRV
jgi:hypothetical protein